MPDFSPRHLSDDEFFRRIRDEYIDNFDEELEMELHDWTEDHLSDEEVSSDPAAFRQMYFRELHNLQVELVKLQDWVVAEKKKVVVLFEGRDSAGKGGAITRFTQRLNPRVCRVAALPAPSDREKTQWYFQRYVPHLPAGGEIVLFDRSWYNRAGVEKVMGFCTDEELEEFFKTVPEFEKMLIGSGIQLIKYWFSIQDEQQQFRFKARIHDPLKRWKLSPMDLKSRVYWEDYTKAKEVMMDRTHRPESPWWVVPADNKKKARLNCIRHFLDQVPYGEVTHDEVELPPRQHDPDYQRRETPEDMIIPDHYGVDTYE